MGRFFYLTKRAKKTKNKKAKKRVHWNPKIASFIMLFFIAIVGMFYVIQVNNLAVKGYHIKELEQEISNLEKLSLELEDRNLTLQSIDRINEKVIKLNMIEAADVEHLSLKKPEVAIAK